MNSCQWQEFKERPVAPLRVFRVYNKVAHSGDVVIEKQGFDWNMNQ
jgi:hypothetical protein